MMLGETMSSTEAFVILGGGLLSLVGTVVAAWFGFMAQKASRETERKLRTNHGLEPWQYLEMIAEVKNDVADLKLWAADHTQQDADRFDELSAKIDAMW